MSHFVRDFNFEIRRQLLKLGNDNPLTSIGLNHKILEVGLTDEDLYDYCRYLARFLLARFHEDRSERTPRTVDLQLRFSEAFTQLKDRAVFDLWLTKFKALRGEDRAEMISLRRVNTELRQRLDETRRQLNRAEQELKETHAQLGAALTQLHGPRPSRKAR